jgi:integrase
MGIIHVSELDRALLPALAWAVLSTAAFSPPSIRAVPDTAALTVEPLTAAGAEPLPSGLKLPLSLTFEPNLQTILPATTKTRRKGYKVMSRRCQMGTEVKIGGWYRVRVRVDVAGEGRIHKSIPICPVSGPDSLNKTERKRKRMEIVAEYNREDFVKKVEAQENGTTFKAQSLVWTERCRTRKRKPIKPSTLHNWQSILDNHVLPVLGTTPLSFVGNKAMKDLVEVLVGKGLSPQSIKNITQVVKLVKASAVDENGDELHPTKWNHDFIDMPVVDETKQRKPSFTGEQVTKIVKATSGRVQMAIILFATTGMRAGELLGLEVRHFDGSSVTVEQEVWSGKVQGPKTPNAKRVIDLHPDAADLLKQFIGDRSTGFVFQTRSGKPLTQTNLLKREFHPILETLGISKRGFHSFRRFRNTHLRKSGCPDGLLKFWMGHANKDMTDRYDKVREDVEFRKDVAKAMGVGVELPKTLNCSNVPKRTEVAEALNA